MIQRILTIAGTELHPSEKLNQFRMDAVNADLHAGLITGFPDAVLNFLPGLFNRLFDSCRMYAAIYYQLLKSDPRHLPADRIKA